jgi:hypothetical protein
MCLFRYGKLRLCGTIDTVGLPNYETIGNAIHAWQMLAKGNCQLTSVEAGYGPVENHLIPNNGHLKLAEGGKMSRVQSLLDALA